MAVLVGAQMPIFLHCCNTRVPRHMTCTRHDNSHSNIIRAYSVYVRKMV